MLMDAVIVAGGQSRRMGGGDKTLLDVAGQPMLAHVIARLEPQARRIAINANGDLTRFGPFGLPVVPDTFGHFEGPLAGILAAMRWCRSLPQPSGHVLTVPADSPLMPKDLGSRLAAAVGEDPRAIAIAASQGRRHPVAGLWPTALGDDLAQALESGVRKVMQWAERHTVVTVDFPMIEADAGTVDPFFNANTPDDLATLEQLLGRHSC